MSCFEAGVLAPNESNDLGEIPRPVRREHAERAFLLPERFVANPMEAIAQPGQFNENLLIEDYPLMVLPKLAVAIGLKEAIVVQRLFWLLKDARNGRVVDTKRWIYNTYEQWKTDHFPFLTERDVRSLFTNLEKMQILLSCQPEGGISRRKHYRLSEGMVNLMRRGKLEVPKQAQNHVAEIAASSDNSGRFLFQRVQAENNYQSLSHSPNVRGGNLESTRKPDLRTKAEKLETLRLPVSPYPSEPKFDAFIKRKGLTGIIDYRWCHLYRELCQHKWHAWNETLQEWKPIRNWQKFIVGLSETIMAKKDRE